MTSTININGFSLRTYLVEAVNYGILFFTGKNQPLSESYYAVPLPVIHNYPLTLALKGLIAEEQLISLHGEIKKTKSPAEEYSINHFYIYPLEITREYLKVVTMSMSETDLVFYKPQTRLSLPLLTRYSVYAPGSLGVTVLLLDESIAEKFPRELLIRIGVKRTGVMKLRLRPVRAEIIKQPCRITGFFNVKDSPNTRSYNVILSHYAGDIGFHGISDSCIKISQGREIILPLPNLK